MSFLLDETGLDKMGLDEMGWHPLILPTYVCKSHFAYITKSFCLDSATLYVHL